MGPFPFQKTVAFSNSRGIVSTKRPSLAVEASRAMFAVGVAALVGTAAYAYSYNLGRFKFNALQRQECLHHYQDGSCHNFRTNLGRKKNKSTS